MHEGQLTGIEQNKQEEKVSDGGLNKQRVRDTAETAHSLERQAGKKVTYHFCRYPSRSCIKSSDEGAYRFDVDGLFQSAV